MPKMIVSLDGIVVKDVVLTKNRTTLGRRPYNDIVIDNLAVSGEHAVIQMSGGQVYIEDLNSTNGTNLNGKTIKRELLHNNDTVEIGKYKIKYFQDATGDDFEKTLSGLGVILASRRAFPDHHFFDRREIEEIIAGASRCGAEAIVTTAKDAVRLPNLNKLMKYAKTLRVDIHPFIMALTT